MLGTIGTMPQTFRSCDKKQLERLGAVSTTWYEERERSEVTLLMARDGAPASYPPIAKDMYWRNYDGGVGDGERPGMSGGVDEQEMECELDYEEEEELEEDEILRGNNLGF
ncbi:hypothetical protein NDU88_002044 [Pleurodeles waltl]|uniref:Uncharacterized protein n=1 Tax=Pleurodeles waltl TaxID=8319 RepID=A0AAV7Q4U4_PLEWA|nr:hypothetical protein NDU88_002044 [Pleurodeles waltl]